MARVVIIGGGFAGLSAARRLARAAPQAACTLIDRKRTLDFLPMIPELLCRRIDPELLQYDLADRIGFRFLHADVAAVDLESRTVTVTAVPSPLEGEGKGGGCGSRKTTPAFDPLPQGEGAQTNRLEQARYGVTDTPSPPAAEGEGDPSKDVELPYDYLVIASGSETNFYDREDLKGRALTIDSVADALRIYGAAHRDEVESVVIVGAGYTGIEVATNLRRSFTRCGRDKRIVILERAPHILAYLAPWMRTYAGRNLARMAIEVATDTALDDFTDGTAHLSDGRCIPNALLIWTAGVRTVDFVRKLDVGKCPQGRIVVDEYLRVGKWGQSPKNGDSPYFPDVFVAGDAACVTGREGKPMRMAVQISLDEGACAGENVARLVKKGPGPFSKVRLVKYRPLDLGWVVPMANGRSCGRAMGFNVRGFPATMLHYLMCLFRSQGFRRRTMLVMQLLARRA